MNKLAKLIDTLSPDDLLKIKRDLIAGNIDRLVEKKLQDHNTLTFSEKQCPICSSNIPENAYILEFGSPEFRRRAFFDAIDCLEYFVEINLKQKNEEKRM